MAWAVNVVFSPGGKVYSFDPNGLELAWDERVICGTSRGPEIARVVTGNHEVERSPSDPPLRPIERRATPADEERVKENRALGRKAMLAFRDLLRERGIEHARPVGAEVASTARASRSPTAPRSAPSCAASPGRSRAASAAASRCARSARARRRASAAAAACAGRCAAARASPRTSSRSRCAWPRIRTSP